MEISIKLPESHNAYEIGLKIVQEIQSQLSGNRSGRFYPVPGNPYYDRSSKEKADNYWIKFTGTRKREEIKGGAYQASAPGEAPAVRTGRLRQSFNMRVVPSDDGQFFVKVTTNVFYADDLEYGTEKIKARPFVKPALEKVIPDIINTRNKFFLEIIRKKK